LQFSAGQIVLSVALARTSDSSVIWAEKFTAERDELQHVRSEILEVLVRKLEAQLIHNEVELARRTPPLMLDAWGAYHLGLDHMFRFSKSDNARAATLFASALNWDPYFSRALSGLSFTCFQDSFLRYSDDREAMAHRARSLAEQALQCDPLDPFAHLNLGRSLWFEKAIPESLDRLTECIRLSPNYAQAIYSKAWAEMTQCEAITSGENAAFALRLSPLDPLRYAMLAVRSVSALLQEDFVASADLAEKAAHSPGAHKHIALIAAIAANAAGREERAAEWVSRARDLDPEVNSSAFFQSFPFVESRGRELIERQLRNVRL
jgi:tetratricopeptide (TPR) repeat protein